MLFDDLADSVTAPSGVAFHGAVVAVSGESWRPYTGLPTDTRVLLHEQVLRGETIMVCNMATAANFGNSNVLLTDYNSAFAEAIDDWNMALSALFSSTHNARPVFAEVTGVGSCDPASPSLQHDKEVDIFVHKRTLETNLQKCITDAANTTYRKKLACRELIGSRPCDNPDLYPAMTDEEIDKAETCRRDHYVHGRACIASGGCIWRPVAKGQLVLDADDSFQSTINTVNTASFRAIIAHEIGHLLGLGDYAQECPPGGQQTLYSYTNLPTHTSEPGCRSDRTNPVTARDVDDVAQIYQPNEFTSIAVERDDSGGTTSYQLTGHVPYDTNADTHPEFNAYRIVAWSRAADGDEWSHAGSVEVFREDGHVDRSMLASHRFTIPLGVADPSGLDLLVAGVTRGDPERLRGDPAAWMTHAEVTADQLGSEMWATEVDSDATVVWWTLGEPATLEGVTPPDPPDPPDPPEPDPDPEPTKVPPAPVLSVTVNTNSAMLTWSESTNDDDRADTYTAVYVSEDLTSGNATTPEERVTFELLESWTGYTFKVTATNAIGSTDSDVVRRRTSETVRGEFEVRRLPQANPGDRDIEFSFVPDGPAETRILPSSRFLTYSTLTVGRWMKSSNVVRLTAHPAQTLGRIWAQLDDDGRVEVCLQPPGGTVEDDLHCPARSFFPYLTATENRWLSSSQVSVTVTDPSTAARAGGTDSATMAPLAPGDVLPEADTERGRLEE